MSNSKTTAHTRNAHTSGGVVPGVGHHRRESVPVPPTKSHPTPTLAGAAPGRAAPAKVRLCKRCRKHSPEFEFLMADHPNAPGIKNWCGECLVESKQVPRGKLTAARRAVARAAGRTAAQAAAEDSRRRAMVAEQNHVSGLALKMYDMAADDPAYAAAIKLAASALDCPREDLAALTGQS